MAERPQDAHNRRDEEFIYDSEEERPYNHEQADMNNSDDGESENSDEQESSSDSDPDVEIRAVHRHQNDRPNLEEFLGDDDVIYDPDVEIRDVDRHQNDRPSLEEFLADGDVIYDSEEERPNVNNRLEDDNDDDEEEEFIFDSEESGEDDNEIHGSDEDCEAGHEGNDGHHNDLFEEFFHINVERGGLQQHLRSRGNVRKYERLFIEIAKVLRYKETYVSLLTSFKIANIEFDNSYFPTTMNGIWKLLNPNLNNFNQSIVCGFCWENLGEAKVPDRACACGRTGPGKTDQLGTFLYLNLPAQLQGLLSKPGMLAAVQYPWTREKRNPDAMEDVYDASVYKQLSANGGFLAQGSNNYSLAMWTDGVDAVESNQVEVWPVFAQILELSPRARQRNPLLAALYVVLENRKWAHFLNLLPDNYGT